MCKQDTDAEAEALAALYADSEGALAELLERLEAEAPALDALLADLEQHSALDALLAELDRAALVCPYCGHALEQNARGPKKAEKGRQIGAAKGRKSWVFPAHVEKNKEKQGKTEDKARQSRHAAEALKTP